MSTPGFSGSGSPVGFEITAGIKPFLVAGIDSVGARKGFKPAIGKPRSPERASDSSKNTLQKWPQSPGPPFISLLQQTESNQKGDAYSKKSPARARSNPLYDPLDGFEKGLRPRMVSLYCPVAGDPGLPFWASLVGPKRIRAHKGPNGPGQSHTQPTPSPLSSTVEAVGLRSFSPLGESSPTLGSAGEQGWEAGACSLGSIPSC